MKNKKTLMSMVLFVLIPVFVFAQNDRVEERERVKTEAETEAQKVRIEAREQVRIENQQRVEELKAEALKRRVEAKNRVQERLLQMHNRVIEVYGSMIKRLNTLAERIDTRIQKLEVEGLDMTESKKLLEEAEKKIEDATNKLSSIKLSTSVNYDNQEEARTEFNTLRQEMQELKTLLRDAHRALVLTIQSIKPGQMDTNTEIES